MEEYKKDSQQDKSKGCQIQEMCGCTEEELLKEFEAACKLDDSAIRKAPEGEADIIWDKILAERSRNGQKGDAGKVVRKRFGWKRVAAVGLIACMLTGGGCFVAMGTKSYFFREIEIGVGNEKVLINDSYKAEVNGENDAYVKIENELGIKSLKLAYVPTNMTYEGMEIRDGYAYMKFELDGNYIYLIQTKQNSTVSYKYKDDSKDKSSVYNKWLKQSFSIEREDKENGMSRFDTSIVIGGTYYGLSGTIDEKEFTKIVERLAF